MALRIGQRGLRKKMFANTGGYNMGAPLQPPEPGLSLQVAYKGPPPQVMKSTKYSVHLPSRPVLESASLRRFSTYPPSITFLTQLYTWRSPQSPILSSLSLPAGGQFVRLSLVQISCKPSHYSHTNPSHGVFNLLGSFHSFASFDSS